MFIDIWLEKQHERFAHWFQKRTGRTNSFLSRVEIIIYFIFSNASSFLVPHPFLFAVFCDSACALVWYYFTIPGAERLAKNAVMQGTKIPADRGLRYVRIFLVSFLIGEIVVSLSGWRNESREQTLNLIGYGAFCSTTYMAFVTPLPPGIERKRAKISSLFMKLVPARG